MGGTVVAIVTLGSIHLQTSETLTAGPKDNEFPEKTTFQSYNLLRKLKILKNACPLNTVAYVRL